MYLDGYQFAPVDHHVSDDYATTESGNRLNFLGINAFPTLLPDGQSEPSYPYSQQILEDTINERLAIPSPCTMNVSGSLVNGELTVNVAVVRDAGEDMPNARVQVVVTENSIPEIWGDLTTVEAVNRDMIPDENGTDLIFDGDNASISVTGMLDPTWVQDNLMIVVFVEDGSNHNVFQSTIKNIELFLAAPGAPSAPDYITATPDPSGALSCELQWYNPLLDFAGEILTELNEMILYRGDEVIYTDSSPEIGAFATFTDNVSEPGMYDYYVHGINSAGEGPFALTEVWVGEDVPGIVTDLLLEIVDNQAYITWTNPTTGLHGGSFNQPIIGYVIVRDDGEVFMLDGINTEYTDSSVPIGPFVYSVMPYNSIGDGGIAETNGIWFGEGSIFNVFITCDDYPAETTWDVVDSAGNVMNSGGPYSTAGEIVDVDCQLAEGDYTFTIYDAYGDGICCAYGEGFYTLSLEGEVIFDGNGEFLTEESTSFTVESGTGVGDDSAPILTATLNQNFPNPFNPTTTINFSIPEGGSNTELVVFNVKGQKVKSLINDVLPTDNYDVVWNGQDDTGNEVSSGLYFYKLTNGNFISTKKMMLMK